jgi:hypothetical protein
VSRWLQLGVLTLLLGVLMGADSGSAGPDPTDVAGLLREFGFPIFVSLWFMWRVEKRMDKFTESIQNLLTAVTIMAKTVDNLQDFEHHQTEHRHNEGRGER